MSQNDDRDEYILENGNMPGAVGRSFEWLVGEWSGTENRDTVIAVPSKGNLENVEGELREALGSSGYKGIHGSENFADLGEGVTIHTMTKRITPSNWGHGPVLGLFVDDEQLEEIDNLNGATSILVVPWHQDDASTWEERWSPDVVEFDPD